MPRQSAHGKRPMKVAGSGASTGSRSIGAGVRRDFAVLERDAAPRAEAERAGVKPKVERMATTVATESRRSARSDIDDSGREGTSATGRADSPQWSPRHQHPLRTTAGLLPDAAAVLVGAGGASASPRL